MMVNSKKLVSFCCLSYNHEKFIRKCMQSIWSQDYKNIEIIVLDDGSSDGSLRVINECKNESPCSFNIITQENSGGKVGSNFNKLINASSGDFLFFISTDDEVVSDSVSSKVELFDLDENLAFALNTYIETIDENSNVIDKSYIHKEYVRISSINELLELEFNALGSFYIQGGLFKKTVIDDIGGFDDDLIGDDIILRTKLFKHIINQVPTLSFKLIDTVGVRYRMHDTNIHKNSLRQSILIHEWFMRYFKDRIPNKTMLVWLNHAYAYTVNNNLLEDAKKLISILIDYLPYFDQEEKKKITVNFFNSANVREYQLNKTLDLNKEFVLKILGDMMIEKNNNLYIEEPQVQWFIEYLLDRSYKSELILDEIYKSFSWRLTKPIRLLAKIFKKFS